MRDARHLSTQTSSCTAAVLSGYKGTCPVPTSPLACVFLTHNGHVADLLHIL
jgi:hypothetical protein